MIFFDRRKIVHKQFLPHGETVNETVYQEILERLTKGNFLICDEVADS